MEILIVRIIDCQKLHDFKCSFSNDSLRMVKYGHASITGSCYCWRDRFWKNYTDTSVPS